MSHYWWQPWEVYICICLVVQQQTANVAFEFLRSKCETVPSWPLQVPLNTGRHNCWWQSDTEEWRKSIGQFVRQEQFDQTAFGVNSSRSEHKSGSRISEERPWKFWRVYPHQLEAWTSCLPAELQVSYSVCWMFRWRQKSISFLVLQGYFCLSMITLNLWVQVLTIKLLLGTEYVYTRQEFLAWSILILKFCEGSQKREKRSGRRKFGSYSRGINSLGLSDVTLRLWGISMLEWSPLSEARFCSPKSQLLNSKKFGNKNKKIDKPWLRYCTVLVLPMWSRGGR